MITFLERFIRQKIRDIIPVILVAIVLGLFACEPKDVRSPSTIAMANMLGQYADTARQSVAYPYFNDFFIRKYEHLLRGMPYGMQPGRRLDYLLLLLMKGRNNECIEQTLSYLKATRQNKGVSVKNLAFKKILALAYLREGEQHNCIENHGQRSCIIPLSGDGIHSNTFGVQQASIVYEELIDFDSLDLQSKWFLNLCYMAMGDSLIDKTKYTLHPGIFLSDTTFKRFENVAMSTGVDTNNHAGGSSIEDFNNDGFLDIFTTSYSLGEGAHLYINDGAGTFTDATLAYGLKGLVGGLNNIHADFDNDGNTDIFITRGAWLGKNGHIPNSFLKNTGASKFVDATIASGLMSYHPTGTAAAADFNLDGQLDLFIGNESNHDKNPSELYLNLGDGTFKDVSNLVNMNVEAWVKAAVWGDINNDMLPDLFLSVYGEKNLLYINRGGKNITSWLFEEIGEEAGVAAPLFSFPALFNDVNNDGLLDLVVFGYDNRHPERIVKHTLESWTEGGKAFQVPVVYLNNGDETFLDVSHDMNMDQVVYAMGANFGDIDNDGFPDLYAGTGEFNMWASVPNKMFRNNGGKKYQDVTTAGGFGQIQKGHGVSFGDLDNDGDQDIYHQVGGASEGDVFHNMLFENPGFNNNWISIDLKGVTSNRSAIGAKIEIAGEVGNATKRIYHWIGTGGSFGANSLRAEIGLGAMSHIISLKISWPDSSKHVQEFNDVLINKHYQLSQGTNLRIDQKRRIKLKNQVMQHNNLSH